MIRIRVKGGPGKIEGFLIWGHARYAPHGRDVVCAGVSAVATTALIGLRKRIPRNVRYRIIPGGLMYCRLFGELPDEAAGDAQTILDVMVLGLKAIRKSHQEYIEITYRR